MCAATVYVQPQRGPSTFGKRWPLNGNVLAVQRQRHAPRRSKFLKYLSKVMPAWWREPSVSRESGSPLSHMRAARGASADSDAANAPSAPPPSGLFLRTLQDQQLRSALTQYAKNDMTLTTHHSRRRPRGSRCSTPTTTVIPPLLRWFVVSMTGCEEHTEKAKGIPLTFPLVPIAVLLGRRGTHTLEMLAFLVTIASREL